MESAAHLTNMDTERFEGPADMNVFVPRGVESVEVQDFFEIIEEPLDLPTEWI